MSRLRRICAFDQVSRASRRRMSRSHSTSAALSTARIAPNARRKKMNARLLILAVCVGACIALDCRKFAFAPACRGIMLKRAEGTEEPSSEDSGEHYLATLMQVHDDLTELKTAIEKATADGKFDCKALTWLKDRMVAKKWDRQFAFA